MKPVPYPRIRHRPTLADIDALESRVLLSAAFDLTRLTDLRLDPAFAGVDGSGVGIAVLDSGVYALHPQLQPNVVAYYNAVPSRVPSAVDASSVALARDSVGHGTHVAGTAAASDPDVGVAPAADIISVKVIPDPGEPQIGGDPLLRGLQFVQRFADQFNIKVVNMSIGSVTQGGGLNLNQAPDPDDITRAIDTLESMGITVVAASGNSYANDPEPGASYPAVASTISVASTWSDRGAAHDFGSIVGGSASDRYFAFENSAAPDRFSATSQRSTLPNQLAAPGVDIYSTWNGAAGASGGDLLHNTLSGTSMASPFVSGLVALMQDAAFTIGGKYIEDVGDVFRILSQTADVVVDADVADNGRLRVVNGSVDPNALGLPETGRTFRRVNALGAMEGVRALVTTGSVGGSGGDTDSRAAFATRLPSLSGVRSIVRPGRIGNDGSVQIGPNDVDLFQLTLPGPGDVGVSLTLPAGGTAFSPSLRLFNAAGSEILRADAAGNAYPALRTNPLAPLPAGTYYVGVSSLSNVAYVIASGSGASGGQSEGDYVLTVATNKPDVDGVAQGAVPIDLTLPDTLAFASLIANKYEGVIGVDPAPAGAAARSEVPGGDVDMFRVVAPDDGVLQARTLGRALYGSGAADTFVRVLDGNLVELLSNDDQSPGDPDSRVDVPVTIGRTYYVAVTNYANRAFDPVDPYARVPNSTPRDEPYNLYLSFDNGDRDGTVVNAAAGQIGEPIQGNVGADAGAAVGGAGGGFKDVDFTAYTAGGDGLIDLSVTGEGGFETALGLWKYDAGQGTVVKIAEASGPGPRLVARVAAGERVYASVTGRGNQNFNWFARASGPGGETGAYALTSGLRPLDDLRLLSDGSTGGNTPGSISAASPVLGSLGSDGNLVLEADVDLYRFVPAAGGKFDFRTDTSQEGSADTVLRLFDETGRPIATNDNATARTSASALRVALEAGRTYFVGVSGAGAGGAGYDPVSGAGAARGSLGAYTLSVAAAAGPAVSVADPAPVGENYRSGSVAAFTISLDTPAAAPITIAYSTADSAATAGEDYTAASGTLVFAPGETSKTVSVPVTADTLAETDEAFFLDVSVVDGAEAAVSRDRAAVTVQNQQVLTLRFGGPQKVSYTDLDGTPVVLSLRGPGSGQVLVLGESRRDVVGLSLAGTTAASTLSVKGDTALSDVDVAGALGGLTGKALDLTRHVRASGPISRVQVRGVADGAVIDAPAIGTLAARGNFGGDVSVGSLGAMTVLGTLLNADVRSAGSIGSVRARSATGSRVFAGVRAEVIDLPDSTDDFANPGGAIGAFTVRARTPGAFADTLVSAPSVGRVVLGPPATANAGRRFGVAAHLMKYVAGGALKLANLSTPGQSKAEGDFEVRVL